ncbi:MAG TPA: hypothetical protein PKY29_03535 [Ferruginibacter sp.]|nr:hypothetical protein [Ferruginibacter sp.]HRO17177.1 hypothetical protein [Ferruginibacter sp.]HRQ20357.1 hypothetical protein [Ferruginibacter sp.]
MSHPTAPAPVPEKEQFTMTLQFRRLENLHIFFWLVKDISWCLEWHVTGIVMIVPTMTAGFIITRKFWHIFSERCHNLAVLLWITANAYWMITEFFGWDELLVPYFNISYRHFTMLPFGIGIGIMLYYYLWWNPRHKSRSIAMPL